MKQLYILILFAHLSSVGVAQDRVLISPFGDVIPVEKGKSARQAVEKNAESHLDANTVIAACDSPRISFGNIYDPSRYTTNFAYADGDVAAMIYVVPWAGGVIESVYFKPNSNQTRSLDASLRIFRVLPGWATTTATYFGYDQVQTPDSCFGATPWPSTCPYVPGDSGTGRFLGEELWGLGGFLVPWPDSSSTVGVRMLDLGYEPSVNASDTIAITLRKPPFEGQPLNAVLRASAPAIPLRFFKYYNSGRISSTLPGWWSREYDMFIWYVLRVPPPLIDPPPTIVSIVGPSLMADTSEQAVRMYAYDSNCIMPGDTGIVAASLYYRVNSGPVLQVAMLKSSGVWIGYVPGQILGTSVNYYVTATDVNNNTSTSLPTIRFYRVASFNQFGYTTTFPPFTFTDLAGTQGATELPGSAFQGTGANDNGTAGPVPIGGTFNFFGRDTMQYAWVSANGGIGLTGTSTDTVWVNSNGTRTGSYANFNIPGTAPRNFIAGFWNNLWLEPDGHGSVWYKQDGSQLIIQWNRVGNFNSAIDTTTTFQIVLDRTDSSITFKYLDVGTTGLNAQGLICIQASSTSDWLFLNQFGYPESTRPQNRFAMKMTYTGPLAVHNQDVEMPSKFALYPNYPNPFNPTTTIRYELPKQVMVSLKVYNVLGQEVASLVSEVQTAGKHQAVLSGESLSSGVYFYRLQAGEFVDTKKLVLLK